jgi:uncharacterized BrkB/YihY/UPF0761 family membrane protein
MSAPGPRSGRDVAVERGLELLDRFGHTPPVRLVRLFVDIDGRDRILMLAGQAFIAVIPLLIVVATVSGTGGSSAVGSYLVRRFALDGSAEESVRILFDRPPEATGGITLLSLVVLVWTSNSFARSLQRTFASAWGLPRSGMRGTVLRTVGLVVLLVVLFGTSWLGNALEEGPVVGGVVVLVQLVILVGGWALASHLMLARRVPARRLLPGAVASAVVQLVVGWGTAIWLPGLVTRNADNYGVIGAALALVSWLILVAATIVASAVLGRVLAPAALT